MINKTLDDLVNSTISNTSYVDLDGGVLCEITTTTGIIFSGEVMLSELGFSGQDKDDIEGFLSYIALNRAKEKMLIAYFLADRLRSPLD